MLTLSSRSIARVFAIVGTFAGLTGLCDFSRGFAALSLPSRASALVFPIKVNFQPAAAAIPSGYVVDSGAVYADRGNGYVYGWNADNSANTRDRNSGSSPDQRFDTLIHTQKDGTFTWEVEVPNGSYQVRLVAGDPSFFDSVYKVNVEGVLFIDGVPSTSTPWFDTTAIVMVTDGKLTVSSATGSANNKLCFMDIDSVFAPRINFQPSTSAVPPGYLADTGAAYADQGNGFSYGWNIATNETRDRNDSNSPNDKYDTLNHMQKPSNPSAVWEIAAPNGTYTIRVTAGDPSNFDSVYKIDAEGVSVVSGTPTTDRRWVEGSAVVTVSDGKITLTNATGSSNNKICFLEITPGTTPNIGTGTGLAAVYYDNADFTGTSVQRTDANLQFTWGTGSPDPAIGVDTFSAVWTGKVLAQFTEEYTFEARTDDGVRLWVNGQLLIDFPVNGGVTSRTAKIALTAGVQVDLRMEYHENTLTAIAQLLWSSQSTPRMFIPVTQLTPTDSVAGPTFLYATAQAADLTKVYLSFSEPMDAASATNTANYTISGGLTVTAASISANKRVVTLTASGNVTVGTTTVTASSSVKSLAQESLQAPFTRTVEAGNSDGIPDSIAIGLLMTTDGNHSAVMMDEPTPHAIPPGLGESLRVTAPGTSATTVTLRQTKKQGGSGRLKFQDSGTNFTTVVTTSGGTPNQAFVTLRYDSTSASEGDLTLEAVVSGEIRGTHDACAVTLAQTPKYFYLADQTPLTVSAQITPLIQGLQFTNKTGAMDFGGTDLTTSSTLLKLPPWPDTNASGQTSRTVSPRGVESFVYDSTQLARPMAAFFGTPESPNVGSKLQTKVPPHEYGRPESYPGTGDYCSTCPNASSQDSSGSNPPNNGTSDVATCCDRRSVDPADGEKKLEYKDLVIRGRGFDYVFRRVFRSFDYRKELASAGASIVRDFGVSWTYSYADEYLLKDGTGAESSSNIINCRAGQSANIFVNIGTDKWAAGKDNFVQLRRNPSTGDFEIRERDGFVRIYHNFQTGTTPNKNGRLKAMDDRNGNRMTFHYEQIDPDNTVGGDDKYVLAFVVDTLGREIRYQYFARTAQTVGGRPVAVASTNTAAFGRLAVVKDFKGNMNFDGTNEPDFPGQDCNRQFQFGYDSEGNLTKARSPIVTGTPNGNDFPNGKTTRYKYYTATHHPGFSQAQWDSLTQSQRDRLLRKLTHIWYPNEVKNTPDTDPADGDAAEVLGYETNTASRFFGFVISYTVGGTNGNGVPSGGTITYTYTDLNPSHGVAGSPYNYFLVQSLKVAVTDRNGNQAEYIYTAEKTLLSYKEFPRGLRAGEPTSFDRQYVSNGNALLRGDRLLTGRTEPQTNTFEIRYNDATTDRFQQGNKTRVIRVPDSVRGGDQAKIEVVFVYEPIFNQPWLLIHARGADMAGNGFTPPISDPATRTITDPYDATKTLNLRYAIVNYYDYQESTLASTAWSATSSWTPTTVDSVTVKATEVLLVRRLGLPDGNDTDRANSIRTVRTRLSANLVKLGLGDLNGDGNTDPKAAGNLIRKAYGSPVLLANTNQHKLEGDIETAGDLVDQTKNVVDGGTQEGTQGARLQTIVWMYQHNSFGQIVQSISPEANVTTHEYFAENDPDGDGIITPSPADGRTLGTQTSTQNRESGGGGYVNDTIVDRTRTDAYVKFFDQSGTNRATATFHNNKTAPQATALFSCSCLYDDVGNLIERDDPRRITDELFVNELNEVVEITRAASIAEVGTADPSDPLLGATIGPLTAFAYKKRTFFDYNGYVVLSQTEDRGNTSSVDGSGLGTLPAQATGSTPGLSSADSAGGAVYVDSLRLYDRLNDLIETRLEVDNTRSLNTRYRYDGNQNLVLVIHPEGNADSYVHDERDLIFQGTRGASTRPMAGKYAAGDPTTFDRPGGSGTSPSTMTFNYDKNKNFIETVDAADTDGDTSNNSSIAGSGDVTQYTYDGYDRMKSKTDPLGNKVILTYDPDSNVVRVLQNGDPADDVVGDVNNKTLVVTEYIHDEWSREFGGHQVLFQTPTVTPSRTPVLTDTVAMDTLAAYLSDASNDTSSVPGATGITVIGRISGLSEFDRENRLTFQVQDDLDETRWDFDGSGRVIKRVDSALSNGFASGAFNPDNLSGNAVEMAYDDNSNVIETKETDVTAISNVAPEVFRTTQLYDSLNRLQTVVDNVSQTSDYRYDSRSNKISESDAAGPVNSRTINRRGLGSTAAVTVNDFGNVTRSTYDGASRLQETETRLTSGGLGDGTNIGATLEGVKTTASTVDAAQSGDGLMSVYYAYDDNSKLLALRDDNGNATANIYDNLNRQKVERKGLNIAGTTFSITGGDSGAFNVGLRGGVTPVDTETAGTDITLTFDPDSNVTTKVDEGGNSFACTYDALNRKKTCTITTAGGFIGTSSQSWKYDGSSRLTQCFDNNAPSVTTDDVTDKFFYDSLSRKVEEQQQFGSASSKAISCSFDVAVSMAVSRPSSCTYPDGRQVDNIYDSLDRLLSRRDNGQSSDIGTYQYIGRSRVATLTFQNNIRLTHIGQVSSQNADVGFDAARRIVNHRWESFTTQALGQGTLVLGFEHQDGNSTPGPMYNRTNNKRIEYKTHDPGNSEQYKYDSAYRLTSTGSGSQGQDSRSFERGTFTNANRSSMAGGVALFQDWDLEGLGNWTRQDDNARVETRTQSDFNEIVDRVVSGNTSTLTQDKNGNTTDTGFSSLGGQNFPGGGLRLEWDALGRVRAAWKNNNTPGTTGDDVLVAEYTYDCHNRRMMKVVTNSGALNGTTAFFYEDWRVVEERDGADAVTNQYTYGIYIDEVWTLDNRRGGAPVAWLNDNTGTYRHFYLSNSLYHVYGLANEGSSTTPGTLMEAYEYDTYGRQTVIVDGNDADAIVNFSANDVRTIGGASTINGSPFQFTGQRVDAESSLTYFKNRYFSAHLGRFLSRDPLSFHDSLNLYEYVHSNPLNGVDPLGTLCTFQWNKQLTAGYCRDAGCGNKCYHTFGGGGTCYNLYINDCVCICDPPWWEIALVIIIAAILACDPVPGDEVAWILASLARYIIPVATLATRAATR